MNPAHRAIAAWLFVSVLLPLNLVAEQAELDRYLAENRFQDAERILDSILAKNPADADSIGKLALLLYNNGFWDRALTAIDRWAALAPADPRPLVYRSATLAALGRADEAEAEYKRLLVKSPGLFQQSAEAHLGYAQLLHESGRFDEALVQIDLALEQLPSNSKLLFWKARIVFELGHPEEALVQARAAVARDPKRPQARSLLLKIAAAVGHDEEARTQAEWLRNYERGRSPQ